MFGQVDRAGSSWADDATGRFGWDDPDIMIGEEDE